MGSDLGCLCVRQTLWYHYKIRLAPQGCTCIIYLFSLTFVKWLFRINRKKQLFGINETKKIILIFLYISAQTTFEKDFASGYLIGEVLKIHQLQDDFDQFSQSRYVHFYPVC